MGQRPSRDRPACNHGTFFPVNDCYLAGGPENDIHSGSRWVECEPRGAIGIPSAAARIGSSLRVHDFNRALGPRLGAARAVAYVKLTCNRLINSIVWFSFCILT